MNKINLMDVEISPMKMSDVISKCNTHILNNIPLLLGVVNVAKLINAKKNIELKMSLQESDIVVADGLPVVWLSRLCGTPLPERVAGIDIMFELLSLANKSKYRVFFLGAKEVVVQKVVQWVRENYPDVQIAGYRNGYFTTEQEVEVAAQIKLTNAHILFVAISPPKKEIFLKKYARIMQVPICHGVGGSFDVVAGVTKRAPLWMQRCALEWFYRVIQEPRRMWKRYLYTNSQFIWLSVLEILRHRFKVQ
jgi:N-acetylglucosaminyldiphosphoundecaprenol N-acetyl-beta-D-mannosaminyltransferase